jgi:hypothetical protein
VGATKRIKRARRECGLLWQPRFFDRALRLGEGKNNLTATRCAGGRAAE